jgi:hypothetical protein
MNRIPALLKRMISLHYRRHVSGQGVRPGVVRLVMPLVVLVFVAGCDSFEFQVVPVSGTVTLNGKPLEGALINTQPISDGNNPNPGPGSFAKTDASGSFSLELVSPIRAGAVVGTHRVRISKVIVKYAPGREDAPIIIRNPLPRNASDGSLQLSVPSEGVREAHFDLVAK